MAETAPGRVALFSIHPRFADAILDGTKFVEFRRTPLADDVTHVVIYATAPVQRVVGTFEVAGVESARPKTAWKTWGHVGGIDRQSFDDYYNGAQRAYVIKVRSPQRLATPLPLAALDPALRPPQSFQYLPQTVLSTSLAHEQDHRHHNRTKPEQMLLRHLVRV